MAWAGKYKTLTLHGDTDQHISERRKTGDITDVFDSLGPTCGKDHQIQRQNKSGVGITVYSLQFWLHFFKVSHCVYFRSSWFQTPYDRTIQGNRQSERSCGEGVKSHVKPGGEGDPSRKTELLRHLVKTIQRVSLILLFPEYKIQIVHLRETLWTLFGEIN